MALLLYNVVMALGLLLCAPAIFIYVALTDKYRRRILGRLGLGRLDCPKVGASPRIWIHALSLGEVASARNLVRRLRGRYPQGTIIFSSASRAGSDFARRHLAGEVDCFVPFPLDFLPSVRHLLDRLAPELFILVETDFWPNFLTELSRRGIPSLLVNGRVSANSLRRYVRFSWLFQPIFQSFSFLAMQTEADAEAMAGLGLDRSRLSVLGNLKYDTLDLTASAGEGISRVDLGISPEALVVVAGSTHPGEEELIFSVFTRLLPQYPDLFLVLAPRAVKRGEALADMAAHYGLEAARRQDLVASTLSRSTKVLILDTLGELAAVYALADLAFIGGSLIPGERGHNPLEAVACGKAVLFGRSMEDFSQISHDLLAADAARKVAGEEELFQALHQLLADPELRARLGANGRSLLAQRQGCTARHLELIDRILSLPRRHA